MRTVCARRRFVEKLNAALEQLEFHARVADTSIGAGTTFISLGGVGD